MCSLLLENAFESVSSAPFCPPRQWWCRCPHRSDYGGLSLLEVVNIFMGQMHPTCSSWLFPESDAANISIDFQHNSFSSDRWVSFASFIGPPAFFIRAQMLSPLRRSSRSLISVFLLSLSKTGQCLWRAPSPLSLPRIRRSSKQRFANFDGICQNGWLFFGRILFIVKTVVCV